MRLLSHWRKNSANPPGQQPLVPRHQLKGAFPSHEYGDRSLESWGRAPADRAHRWMRGYSGQAYGQFLAHAHTNGNSDSNPNPNPDSHTNGNAHSNPDTDTDTDTDSDSDSDSFFHPNVC